MIMTAPDERLVTHYDALGTIEIFKDLSHEEVLAVAQRCRWHCYQAQQMVVDYRDEAGDVFFIVRGKVRVTFYSTSGREVTFRELYAGKIFGELSAIDGGPRSASVVAVTDSLLASLKVTDFWDILRNNDQVTAATLRWLVCLVRSLSVRVIEFSTLDVQRRIRSELLRLARETSPVGNTAMLERIPTHTDFANRISTHREAVTRELNHLTRAGLIEKCGTSLLIRDIAVLSTMVNEEQ
jgi:CRP/FNR family cyclic AMP-dependent transcriptional regulator